MSSSNDSTEVSGNAGGTPPALSLFHHEFHTGNEKDDITLLLLHGTGGNERDLLDLGATLRPTASRLSPRGRVLEQGMPRFFRRIAEGVFDLEDLEKQTRNLADFVDAASTHYGFARDRVVAVGYSNGANIAVNLLMTTRAALFGAVLFHPLLPALPERLPELKGVRVFVGAGRSDRMIAPERAEELIEILKKSGADVRDHWERTGHELNRFEVEAAITWFRGLE